MTYSNARALANFSIALALLFFTASVWKFEMAVLVGFALISADVTEAATN